MWSYNYSAVELFFYFVQLANKCSINWQFIILLLHASILSCHLQAACSQYLLNFTYVFWREHMWNFKLYHQDCIDIYIYIYIYMFVWPCIVTNFFVIKPTRCTNFINLFYHETACFGQFVCLSSGVHSLYTQQWYMSYRFVDSFRAGLGWNAELKTL